MRIVYHHFNHIDIVLAIRVFTIGIGNVWARASGGSVSTSMVTGVLFLVSVSTDFWDPLFLSLNSQDSIFIFIGCRSWKDVLMKYCINSDAEGS
jgi:hypothetical protein